MRRLLLVLPFIVAACDAAVTDPRPVAETAVVASTAARAASAATCTLYDGTYARGFNEFGYNYCARNFVGVFGGWCAAYNAKIGQPVDWTCASLSSVDYDYRPFANDHLVMKWNAEWDRGNAEKWLKPPYDAWEDNEWNGMRPGGSKYTEHFKTKWSADCAAGVTPTTGGYCIWGPFYVTMDQGMDPDHLHWWAAHALPAGYGN